MDEYGLTVQFGTDKGRVKGKGGGGKRRKRSREAGKCVGKYGCDGTG